MEDSVGFAGIYVSFGAVGRGTSALPAGRSRCVHVRHSCSATITIAAYSRRRRRSDIARTDDGENAERTRARTTVAIFLHKRVPPAASHVISRATGSPLAARRTARASTDDDQYVRRRLYASNAVQSSVGAPFPGTATYTAATDCHNIIIYDEITRRTQSYRKTE